MLVAAAVVFAALQGAPGVDYRQVREVRDAANFPFDAILDGSDEVWMLIQVTPAAGSGGVVAKGAHIDVETGAVVTGPGARFPVVESGTWERVAALAGASPPRGDYRWEIPDALTRRRESGDLYSPFARGGLVACRLHDARTGADRFGPVHLVPQRWGPLLAPALEAHRADRTLFALDEPSRRAELERKVTADDPWLALLALRALAAKGSLEGDLLQRALTRGRDERQASLTYLALTRAPERDAERIDGAIVRSVGAASGAGELKGLALGLLAATYPPSAEGVAARSQKLLRALGKKQATFGSSTEADRYVRAILDLVAAGPGSAKRGGGEPPGPK